VATASVLAIIPLPSYVAVFAPCARPAVVNTFESLFRRAPLISPLTEKRTITRKPLELVGDVLREAISVDTKRVK
jgi:hypothetical protein